MMLKRTMRGFLSKSKLITQCFSRNLSVLGIETSCDDTGVAIVNGTGVVLGQSLISQQNLHLKYGGIIPPIAQNYHRQNIEKAVEECLKNADYKVEDVDAIAVTNCPGLELSLTVGVRFAKHFARAYNKPLIPVHHMEAHALTARMNHKIPYPFLCLLISGGHCQLVFVKSTNKFYLLGESLDDAPGEAFDKIARRLKLRNLKQYEWMSGGRAIELAAKEATNPDAFQFPLPLTRYRDCQFSFAGLKNSAEKSIRKAEIDSEIGPDDVIPNYRDFCAGFLHIITKHLCHRTQRAIEYCRRYELFDDPQANQRLVISGGVACNDYIFEKVAAMAEQLNVQIFRPEKKYCCDNGAMIGWNGVEKIHANGDDVGVSGDDLDKVEINGKCSLGTSIIDKVKDANLSCKWIKF